MTDFVNRNGTPSLVGCGRKIRTGQRYESLIKQVLESVVHRKHENPSSGQAVVDLEVPPDILKDAHLLLSTGEFGYEYPCCTIIHDDCERHIGRFPPRFFDLTVTDPPYGMNFTATQKHHGDIDWDKEFPFGNVGAMIDAKICDLARLGSYFFCRWDNLWDHEKRTGVFALPKPKSVLVWHKVGGGGGTGDCLHEHTRDYEMAMFYRGPEHKFMRRPKSVLSFKAPGNNAHPTEKPVDLIKEILGWYDFETVFDPYMGSGTTAVAAKKLKKHFLGFERDETYYRRAIKRIADLDKKA